MAQNGRNKKIAATLGLLAIVIVVGAGVALGTRKTSQSSLNTTPTPISTTTTAPSNSTSTGTTSTGSNSSSSSSSTKYKSGTYTATGSYNAPGGTEQIGITLSIANDRVMGASGSNEAFDGRSAQYEDQFISDFKSQVIGVKVDSISVFTGATLTLIGFDNALAKIESQAKA